MWFSSLMQNPKRSALAQRRRIPAAPRQRATFRPRLEALEDRWMPSVLTVTNNLDNGSVGSLRSEIFAAQNGDTIVFSPSLKGQTITLSGNELEIEKSLTIQGLGAKYLAISGGGTRVFDVAPLFGQYVQVTLSGMTIENGNGMSCAGCGFTDPNFDGGGIVKFGRLTLNSCTVTGNSANLRGGGIANELGGTMTISGCTVSDNYSRYFLSTLGWGGGGIYNDGTMTLSGSTVTQNSGYGIWNDLNGILTILNSQVKANKPGDLVNYGTLIG